MSDLNVDAVAWLDRFAEALGIEALTESEIETLLNLAGVAAHASHRQAAPVACWLSARAGMSPAEALALASSLS
jgi:Domain of unknown function (DUF6457)